MNAYKITMSRANSTDKSYIVLSPTPARALARAHKEFRRHVFGTLSGIAIEVLGDAIMAQPEKV